MPATTSEVSIDEVTARFIELRREGLNDTQIAAQCGYSQAYVSVRFARARAQGFNVPPSVRPYYVRGTLSERFWQKVDKETGPLHETLGRCWVWKGNIASHGYASIRDTAGVIGEPKQWLRAHRVAYALEHGVRLTRDVLVRHKCDNAKCVRHDHLELGTQKENIGDAISRGRMTWQQGRTAEETLAQRARAEKRRAAKLAKERAA
jgi:hypothetical protein